MKKWLVILGAASLLAACTAESTEEQTTAKPQKPDTEQTDTVKKPEDKPLETAEKPAEVEKGKEKDKEEVEKPAGEKPADKATGEQLPLKEYFLKDGKKAHYLGEGIEFATYDVETRWLSDNYVAHYVNNGGVEAQRVYRITDTAIELVVDEVVQGTKPDVPKVDWLDKVKPLEIVLQSPLTKGSKFDKWTVVKTDETIITPVATYNNVIVLEDKGKDYTDTRYFAKGVGEIKTVYVMDMDNNETYRTTSTLDKIY